MCGAYRPGTCSNTDTTLLDAIDAGIDNAKTTCSRVIVAGDFNVYNTAWLGPTRTTVAGEAAEDLCYLHGLEQHVQEPTRGRNLLDLIMTDMEGNISTSIHQPLGKSDHATVLADFDQLPLREPPPTRTVWRYQCADLYVRAFFLQCDWPNIVSDDVNQSCTALTNIIKSGMARFIPNKTYKTKLTDPAWWSPECSSAIKKKAEHGGYTAATRFLQISKERTKQPH